MMEVTAAANQGDGRGGMVRRTVGAATELLRPELTDQRQDGGRSAGRLQRECRHQAWQAGSQHRFAGAGRADHQ